MLKICKENKQSILEKVKNGHLDTASLCSKNLIDEIILAMYTNDILSYICKSIPVVSVLFGYLFFQLFTMLPDGEQYSGKSLPIILKNFDVKIQGFVVLYVGSECGVITIFELIELYANSNKEVKEKLKPILERL